VQQMFPKRDGTKGPLRFWRFLCRLAAKVFMRALCASNGPAGEIFRDDPDHFHFLELLSQLGERYGARVHAYVPRGTIIIGSWKPRRPI